MHCCAKCSTPGFGCANTRCRCHAYWPGEVIEDQAPALSPAELLKVVRFGFHIPEQADHSVAFSHPSLHA